MLNKNLVHVIDDIFWNMGFKTATQADKVMHIIPIIAIITMISIISMYKLHQLYVLVQVRQDPGTCGPREAGQEDIDCPTITWTISFVRARWLSYIRRVYPGPEDGAADVGLVVGDGTLVVAD